VRHHRLPDHVLDILARHDAGEQLEDHELMTVQMVRNGYGCHACRATQPKRNPASAN
jgi:hypothetical protein